MANPTQENSQKIAQEFRNDLDTLLNQPVGLAAEDIQLHFGLDLTPQEACNATFRSLMVRQLVLSAVSGDAKAVNQVLDRVLGKPLQVNENHNTHTLSYYDLVDQIQEEEDRILTITATSTTTTP